MNYCGGRLLGRREFTCFKTDLFMIEELYFVGIRTHIGSLLSEVLENDTEKESCKVVRVVRDKICKVVKVLGQVKKSR